MFLKNNNTYKYILSRFRKLSHFFPEASCILGNIKDNQERWLKTKKEAEK